MKLTIGNQVIALPVDARINLEKSSPVFNEDTGSFSYPFPVPTKPNQRILGWPGKLERVGDIPDKTFVLEEQGLQLLRGQVDYDDITEDEIGVILKSAMTDFFSKMDGKKFSDINMGNETLWPKNTTWSVVENKFTAWSNYNDAVNSPLIAAPTKMTQNDNWNKGSLYSPFINGHNVPESRLWLALQLRANNTYVGYGYFMLQAKIWWVLEKIFEACGYTVLTNDLKTDSYTNTLVLFTKPFYVAGVGNSSTGPCTMEFFGDLEYSKIMPDVAITDFVKAMMNLLCVSVDIDEQTLEVSIFFRKNLVLGNNVNAVKLPELKGWIHTENRSKQGFTLSFGSQDDELDTRSDYTLTAEVDWSLPAPTKENDIYKVNSTGREFICLKDSNEALYWKQVGRLKNFEDGNGEEKTEINVKIPKQEEYWSAEGPKIEVQPLSDLSNGYYVPLAEIYISIYRGRCVFNDYHAPMICADEFSIGGTYPLLQFIGTITPRYLNDHYYNEWLKWKTYRARFFTKYLQLTLPQLLSLQWKKRYVVNGVEFFLNKVSYDLPHRGTVKIEGYTY
jgi:hypothetical protein